MKLISKNDQFRRDCYIDIECQNCKHKKCNFRAYDDRHYWDNVLPNIKCEKCKESTNSLNAEKQYIPTKYGEFEIV